MNFEAQRLNFPASEITRLQLKSELNRCITFNFNQISTHVFMSTQSIAQIIAQISNRFQRLQQRLSSNTSQQKKSVSIKENNPPDDAAVSPVAAKSDWWARLYRGLVMDSTARHYQQMGQAVWLFLYFLLNANWKTGELYRRLSTISEESGFNYYAVRRWLRVLQRNGYINAYYNGRFWSIRVNKWRPLSALFERKQKPVPRWRRK